MKDPIIDSYLRAFRAENSFAPLSDPELFEHFVNDLVVRQHYAEPFDLEAISTGGGLDCGIDGLAIVVNDHIVTDCDMVDYYKEHLKRLDVTFIFIQSKTASKFDSGDIGNFLSGVRQFFGNMGPANEKLRSAQEVKDHIYEASIDMDHSPTCELIYATLGTWLDDPVLTARVDSELSLLRKTGLFSEVSFRPYDAGTIRLAYQELHRRVCKEIVFERRCELAPISGVEQAFIGSLPASEYLKLICDPDGRLQRSLFFDNVRDFQGNNPVNKDIAQTLDDADMRDRFAVLNNGVTIVAQVLNQVGPRFKLTNFQIVNGCQTSHILYAAKDHLEKVEIPIKLIVTKENEVANLVTRATNRQTEVKAEAFESLNAFQRDLEDYYRALHATFSPPLVYERRSKQYAGEPIDKRNIVTLTAQIRSFLAMFFSEPHETYHYYGELMTKNRGRIFVRSHSPALYYTAAAALHVLEGVLSSEDLPRRFAPYKFQILLLFRLAMESEPMPPLGNHKAAERYCIPLLSAIKNTVKARQCFIECGSKLDVLLQNLDHKQPPRSKKLTEDILASMGNAKSPTKPPPPSRSQAVLKSFSSIREWGVATPTNGQADIFVHVRGLRDITDRTRLSMGAKIEFALSNTPKGPRAVDITVIK